MKPAYSSTEEVPQAAKDQAIDIQLEQTKQKLKEGMPEAAREKALAGAEKSAVSKLFKTEVLFEQELATSDSSQTVRQYLADESKRLGSTVSVEEWALFAIK